MNELDVTPTPTEELILRFLGDYRAAPSEDRPRVLEQYVQNHPRFATEIREMASIETVISRARPETPQGHALQPGQRLGPFHVVRFVNRGGMGEVYEARQDNLDRRVALKVIRNGFTNPMAKKRFEREQQVMAKLHQTNIVPIHYAGEEGAIQYCAMEFVNGVPLNKVLEQLQSRETSAIASLHTPPIRELVGSLVKSREETETYIPASASPPPSASSRETHSPERVLLSPAYFESVARVMIQVAAAVQHGHEHNVCHRDLKPSNLMIDSEECCSVIDYGLAGAVNAERPIVSSMSSDTPLTQGAVGTPPYMSPEQFDGLEGHAGPPSDIWSLGTILYELLTLHPAFRGTWSEIEKKVKTEEPTPPRDLVRNIPLDLAAICRKAIRKAPSDRYPSARAFADDLQRWLNSEPIMARPARVFRRLGLWTVRNKGWASAIACAIVASVMGGVLAYAAADARADTAAVREKAANEATEQKQKQKQFVELQQQQDRQKAVLESQEISVGMHSSGWSREAMRLLENANAIRPGDDLRDLAAATLIGLDAAPIYEHEFPYPPKPGQMGVGRVVFSPDGVRVLAAGWRNRNRNDLSPALLWDGNIANKSTPSARPGEGPVAFPDANSPLQLILPIEPRQPLTLWNVGTNTKVMDIPLPWPGEVVEAALSADARFAAVSFVPLKRHWLLPKPVTWLLAIDRKAATPTGKKVGEWPGIATALEFTPDGLLLACGSDGGAVIVRSTLDSQVVLQFVEGALPITGLGFGRNYRRSSGEQPALAGAADKWLLAVGSKGGGLSVWDLRSPTPTRMNRFYGSEHAVYGAAFSPDGTLLASCGRNYPFVWDVATGRPQLRVVDKDGGFRLRTHGVAFTTDGRHLAFGSPTLEGYGGLGVYRLNQDRGVSSYRGVTGVIEKTWLSPSGKWVAALAQNW